MALIQKRIYVVSNQKCNAATSYNAVQFMMKANYPKRKMSIRYIHRVYISLFGNLPSHMTPIEKRIKNCEWLEILEHTNVATRQLTSIRSSFNQKSWSNSDVSVWLWIRIILALAANMKQIKKCAKLLSSLWSTPVDCNADNFNLTLVNELK